MFHRSNLSVTLSMYRESRGGRGKEEWPVSSEAGFAPEIGTFLPNQRRRLAVSRISMTEDASPASAWFSSPMYSRYWQHYHQALAWQQRHRRAYMRAVQAVYSAPYSQPHYQGRRQRDRDWQVTNRERYGGEDGDEDEESSESEIECDVSNMEISEELRQYFAHTEKHRAELKRQQELEAEQQDVYVPADQDLHASSWRTSGAPPAERPGERRRAEMKKLYGRDAAKIQAMEAAMQLNFERNCDCKQPKYWPVIPLRL